MVMQNASIISAYRVKFLNTVQTIAMMGKQLDLMKMVAYTVYVSDPHSTKTRFRSGAALRVPNEMLHNTKLSREHTNMWRERWPPGIMPRVW
jgi:hypothetical protein